MMIIALFVAVAALAIAVTVLLWSADAHERLERLERNQRLAEDANAKKVQGG